jgi:hypothetical protein
VDKKINEIKLTVNFNVIDEVNDKGDYFNYNY